MWRPAFYKIKTVLNKKLAVCACLLLAVSNKSLVALLYTSLKGDKALYLLFTKGFLETGRFVEPISVFETGSTIYMYNPAVNSPFYSLLAAPFLGSTHSYFWTQFVLTVLSWILFYTALYATSKLIFGHRWLTNIFILFSAFFLYPHELASTPKDSFAAGFSLWGIFFTYRFIEKKPRWITVFLLAASLTCLATVKLLYLPVVVVLLSLVFIFMKKDKLHFIQLGGLTGCLLLFAFLINTLVLQPAEKFQNTTVQMPRNAADTQRGFYPQNLVHTYPFITSSVLNTELWATQAGTRTPLSFGQAMKVFLMLDAGFIFLALFLANWKRLLSSKVFLLLVCASLAIVSVVMGLSVMGWGTTYKSTNNYWTYVMDARSFLLPMIACQLGLFVFIFQYTGFTLLRKVLLFLFLLEAIHGVYFTLKEAATAQSISKRKSVGDALDRITQMQKRQPAVLVTSDPFLRRYAQVQRLPVYAFTNLAFQPSWIKTSFNFIIATPYVDSLYLKKLPQKNLEIIDTIPPFVLHRFAVDTLP